MGKGDKESLFQCSGLQLGFPSMLNDDINRKIRYKTFSQFPFSTILIDKYLYVHRAEHWEETHVKSGDL